MSMAWDVAFNSFTDAPSGALNETNTAHVTVADLHRSSVERESSFKTQYCGITGILFILTGSLMLGIASSKTFFDLLPQESASSSSRDQVLISFSHEGERYNDQDTGSEVPLEAVGSSNPVVSEGIATEGEYTHLYTQEDLDAVLPLCDTLHLAVSKLRKICPLMITGFDELDLDSAEQIEFYGILPSYVSTIRQCERVSMHNVSVFEVPVKKFLVDIPEVSASISALCTKLSSANAIHQKIIKDRDTLHTEHWIPFTQYTTVILPEKASQQVQNVSDEFMKLNVFLTSILLSFSLEDPDATVKSVEKKIEEWTTRKSKIVQRVQPSYCKAIFTELVSSKKKVLTTEEIKKIQSCIAPMKMILKFDEFQTFLTNFKRNKLLSQYFVVHKEKVSLRNYEKETMQALKASGQDLIKSCEARFEAVENLPEDLLSPAEKGQIIAMIRKACPDFDLIEAARKFKASAPTKKIDHPKATEIRKLRSQLHSRIQSNSTKSNAKSRSGTILEVAESEELDIPENPQPAQDPLKHEQITSPPIGKLPAATSNLYHVSHERLGALVSLFFLTLL